MSNTGGNEYELPGIGEQEKLSILVIDDEKSNIDVINHILGDKYTIFIAKSGAAGLKVAQESHPDLILLDIVMPDMDGFEVLSQLKKTDLTKNTPVIFITGQDSIDDEIKGLKLGAVDYITKPFHSLIVETRVHTHMQMVEQMRIIRRLSTTDELTGLPNRRYFNGQMNKECGRAIREASWLSLLIIDIDRFKVYNDTYGHPQGDIAMQAVAKVFEKVLKRTSDIVARWGGEEFTMLLPRTDAKGAAEVAEHIRASIENLIIPCADGTPTRITVSIGANAELPTITETTPEGLVSGADKALYQAKKSGRNRICVCENR